MENEIGKNLEKPQIFLKSITFNDNTSIDLERNSIIVFTGANNSGKSQTLKDIEIDLDKTKNNTMIVIKSLEYDYCGDIEEQTFFDQHFSITDKGYYQAPEYSDMFFNRAVVCNCWKKRKLTDNLHKLFVKLLNTELRLVSSNAVDRSQHPEQHPIYKLNNSDELAKTISDYFHQAFGVDLIVNWKDIKRIPLHVGQAPNGEAFTINQQTLYYNQVAALPKLQEQGDGMRSFASILLDTFTSDHTITLIDEPEAFLHPPQARILGKMLAKNNPDERQLLITTHSEDFLQGLIDADSKNVTVVRINRNGYINQMSILSNDEIKKLWDKPLLRYSNILSGLFHEKVIVCESDYDCLFYQAIMDAIYESKNEVVPNVLFTHCGGKDRIKEVVSALKAVGVPVVAVCDFDLLNSKSNFKAIIEAFGVDWDNILSEDMQTIYNSMNTKNDGWNIIKNIGKHGFDGNESAAYEKVEYVCKDIGLFIVPVGEMECFDKTPNKKKKEWVYYVLENYNLANEPKLNKARDFIQEILNFN